MSLGLFLVKKTYVFLVSVILCVSVTGRAQEIENPCGSGRFMDSKGVCYDCQTEAGAPDVSFNETAQALCVACQNRTVVQNTCRLSGCESGRFFRDQTGACLACDSSLASFVGSDREAQNQCRACGNREVTHNNMCRLTRQACVPQKGFYSENDACFSCDYPHRVSVGQNKTAVESCTQCPNREVVGGLCQIKPTACRRGQKFTGAKESCYDCDTDEAVDIGKNVLAQHACLSCPNRIVTPAGKCVKTVCPSGQIMDENGICYPCDAPKDIVIGTGGKLIDLCLMCSNRRVQGNLCTLSDQGNVPYDQNGQSQGQFGITFTDMSGDTYDCAVKGGVPVGYVASAKESCEKCQNRFVSTTNLCLPMVCGENEFMDAAGFCHICDDVNGVFVGWGENRLEKMCLNCPNRRISNGYCRLK